MNKNDDIALSVRNLKTFFYTNNRCNKAVNGVSFDVEKGKTLCIVGESGCGKSVTAATIMQLLPTLSRIEEGEIIFNKDFLAQLTASLRFCSKYFIRRKFVKF